jgi:hypothetical protein
LTQSLAWRPRRSGSEAICPWVEPLRTIGVA